MWCTLFRDDITRDALAHSMQPKSACNAPAVSNHRQSRRYKDAIGSTQKTETA